MAYSDHNGTWWPCKKYVNHEDECGYADNTPY